MSFAQNPAVVLTNLSFAWPDGDAVLSELTATFNPGRTGLIAAVYCRSGFEVVS